MGQTAALALSALCVRLLLSNAHGAECVIDDILPWKLRVFQGR